MTDAELLAGRYWRPQGTAHEFLYNRSREVVYSGPAGTGKSRTSLEKIHICANKYPGCRILITRKTRDSLSESSLVTFENHVVPANHPILMGVGGNQIQRQNRSAYHYPNGSEIVLGGMNKVTRILSTEYDLIYVPEAIELDLEDWETLMSRLRNGVMPYQQIIADTNPGSDSHWLYQRHLEGRTVMLHSRHEDNPRLYNTETGEWTEEGIAYIGTLDRLTGSRKQRLRFGRWVGAEGVIYDEIDELVHRDPRHTYPGDWIRVWVVDFGFTNPFSFQSWAVDHDGRMYREREIYRTGRIVEDHAKDILRATSDTPPPTFIVCDHDAEDRATLERHLKMPTMAAQKDVTSGIQAVKERLRVQDDGKPRLMFGSAPVHEIDLDLRKVGHPASTWEEFSVYVWDQEKDKPVKKHDHGMDNIRYAVMAVDSFFGTLGQSSTLVRPGKKKVVLNL